jgi:hypothetical protein
MHNRDIDRNSVIELLLTLNIKTSCCGWYNKDVVEKKSRSLRSYWLFSAHRVSRHVGTDVRSLDITVVSSDVCSVSKALGIV